MSPWTKAADARDGSSRRTASGCAMLLIALLLGGCPSFLPLEPQPDQTDVRIPPDAPRVSGVETQQAREHRQLIAAFGGEYRIPAINQLLGDLSEKLSRASDLPGQRYRVTVLNSPIVNAFALPSGNVYLTRGLLALANDTSEIASVLAHEIAHVTARHAVAREELEKTSTLVSRVEAEIRRNPAGADAVRSQRRLAIASFSRQQELEADEVSVRTIAKAGYDPYGASRFLASLARTASVRSVILGEASNPQLDITSTHPTTPERIQRVIAQARQAGAPGIVEAGRNRWLTAVSGMTFGEDQTQGFARGRSFVHPKLGFSFSAPEDFVLENTTQAVIGIRPGRNEALRLDTLRAAGEAPLTQYLEKNAVVEGAENTAIELLTVDGLAGATALARDREWTYRVFVARFGGRIYRVTLAAMDYSADTDQRFRSAIETFKRLSPKEAAAARPYRIAIVTAASGDTAESLAAKMAFPDRQLDRFLVINGLEPDDAVSAGTRYKVVVE